MTRYRWVTDRKAEGFPVTMACAVAEVSRQAFYDWRLRVGGGPTEVEQAEGALVEVMRAIHDEFDETYGSPRMTVELTNQGHKVNHKRVERLMRVHGIVGVGVSGCLCKRLGSWCVSFLHGFGLQVEGYLAGEVDRELVEGPGPFFDRVGPFLLSVA